jgi:26S proteasome regulatory subunit N3
MQPGLAKPMQPYYELTQAVRAGDLHQFKEVTERYEKVFAADRVQNVIVRLRHNVIRAGLKRISLAYSRISLADVAAKLGLQNVEDTEFIVAKAIRDGGIDAVIDHQAGTMSSKEVVDIYSTDEPQAAFHARVAFCLDIHNEAVKAMRFEPDAHKKSLDKVMQERAISDAEVAKAIEEADEDEL